MSVAHAAHVAAPGRHEATIEAGPGHRVFVKRATGDAGARALAREAGVLRMIGRIPAVSALAPSLVGEEPGVLRMEVVGGSDLRGVEPCPGARMSVAVGRALAAVHVGGETLPSTTPEAVASAVFAAPRPDIDLLRQLSAAGIELLRVMQRSGPLCEELVRMGGERTDEVLVHGDVRFANVMADGDAVRLVDWEFAGRGDARDDLGGFVGSCLEAWISSVPPVPGVPPERLVGLAGCPLEAVIPVIDAFLRSYAEGRGLGLSAAEDMRTEAVRFAAARLVHLAFEVAAETEDLRMDHVLRLQVAANILADPGAARERLLATVPAGDA